MTVAQISLDLAGKPSARVLLERISEESRDEAEKGRWFEQLFMRVALREPEFEIHEIWRWPDWPERKALTGLDGRNIGVDLVARRTWQPTTTLPPLPICSGHGSTGFMTIHRRRR